jgi:hypothetical protein
LPVSVVVLIVLEIERVKVLLFGRTFGGRDVSRHSSLWLMLDEVEHVVN